MAKKATSSPSPKFSVGQVVRIDTDYYRLKRQNGNERYQRITAVWPWVCSVSTGTGNTTTRIPSRGPLFGYTFLNGDMCSEKFIVPLTTKEKG